MFMALTDYKVPLLSWQIQVNEVASHLLGRLPGGMSFKPLKGSA
jgi:hypothetical protein